MKYSSHTFLTSKKSFWILTFLFHSNILWIDTLRSWTELHFVRSMIFIHRFQPWGKFTFICVDSFLQKKRDENTFSNPYWVMVCCMLSYKTHSKSKPCEHFWSGKRWIVVCCNCMYLMYFSHFLSFFFYSLFSQKSNKMTCGKI